MSPGNPPLRYRKPMSIPRHPGGAHRAPAHPDPVVLRCTCCDTTLIITRHNLRQLLIAAAAAWPAATSLHLNIGRLPAGDWVTPASPERIAEAVAAAVYPPDED
jgi:hypothetical protein